ncbi:hypothetical protein A4S06_10570 [Erysipelotrichaceae bacterium MTC7]|nr:hypothetical protein A4S06_10570 [Erysipelotrichaceae bacterium MTC7]
MQEKLFQVVCPNCKQAFFIKRDTVINHEIDDDSVLLLENRSLFVHTCNHCRTTIPLDYPVLYYFPKERIYIGYHLKGEGSLDSKSYETDSIEQFVEYVMMVRDGVMIDAILELKQGLLQGYTYDGMEANQLFFRNDGQLICLPKRDA